MKLENIDPALGLLQEFSKLSQGTAQSLQKMRQDVLFKTNAIDSKFKLLGSVLWSISARCDPCIRYYSIECLKKGISIQEFSEFISIASVMGGCVGETWALKAYKAFKDGANDATSVPNTADPSCCT